MKGTFSLPSEDLYLLDCVPAMLRGPSESPFKEGVEQRLTLPKPSLWGRELKHSESRSDCKCPGSGAWAGVWSRRMQAQVR